MGGRVIQLELKKALKNRYFLIAILVGSFITTLAFLYNVGMYQNNIEAKAHYAATTFVQENPLVDLTNLFSRWVGGEDYTLGSVVYFFVFPILVAVPYGWSYCVEAKSGYVRGMVTRCGRAAYFGAKYLAVFLSGGLAMVLPLLYNFLLTALFIPAAMPNPLYAVHNEVFPTSLLSMVYYSHPFVYVALYLLLDFVFCGLLACLCFAVSAWVKNRVVVTLVPFALLVLLHYFSGQFAGVYKTDVSMLSYLRPVSGGYPARPLTLLCEGAALLLFTLAFTVVRGRRHEIY